MNEKLEGGKKKPKKPGESSESANDNSKYRQMVRDLGELTGANKRPENRKPNIPPADEK